MFVRDMNSFPNGAAISARFERSNQAFVLAHGRLLSCSHRGKLNCVPKSTAKRSEGDKSRQWTGVWREKHTHTHKSPNGKKRSSIESSELAGRRRQVAFLVQNADPAQRRYLVRWHFTGRKSHLDVVRSGVSSNLLSETELRTLSELLHRSSDPCDEKVGLRSTSQYYCC